MDDNDLALTFLGENGSFFIKNYYLLCEYADNVNQYACDVVNQYLYTFRYDPIFS